MQHINRPDPISTILKTIHADEDASIGVELETYIAELEAKQFDRPARIVTILSQLDARYPADVGLSLATYISELEAKQQPILPDNSHTTASDTNHPAVWSHARAVKREQQIRERNLKKQNKSY